MEIGLFIISTTDQDRRAVHCLDSLDRRIRIRSFRVIVIDNPVLLCHIFNTMLNPLKCKYRLTDHIQIYTVSCCHCNRCHNILIIVDAKDL